MPPGQMILQCENDSLLNAAAVIQIHEPTNHELRVAYEQIISRNFADNDRDDLSAIRYFIRKYSSGRTLYKFFVATMGKEVVGCTAFGVFLSGEHSFFKAEYTAVRDDSRGLGIGRSLVKERFRIAELIAAEAAAAGRIAFSVITVRTSDLLSWGAESIWSKLGYRKINYPFTQLPLRPRTSPVTDLVIGYRGHTDEFVRRDKLQRSEVQRIVNACNQFRISDRVERHENGIPRFAALLDWRR